MNLLSGQSGDILNEFVSQDISTQYTREIKITRVRMMLPGGKNPDLVGSIPNPLIPAALTGITARYRDGVAFIDYYYQGERALEVQSDLVQSAQGNLSTEPITSHEKIGDLIKNYASGLRNGQVLWKDYLTTTGSTGTTGGGQTVTNVNPFSNVDSFLYPALTYNITQSFANPPQLQIDRVGKIAASPIYGNLPQLPTNFNWLYAGFDIEQYGYVYRITLKYLKSARGGWQVDIYG